MNTRFTIEEENIVAIYAEDSRETTLENILAAMPYMDEDMRQLAAAAVNKLQAMTDSEFSEGVYLDRRGIAIENRGAVADFRHRACSFLRGQLESRFAGLNILYRLCRFHALEAAETQAFSALNIPLATPCFAPYRSCSAPCFGTGKEYYRRSFDNAVFLHLLLGLPIIFIQFGFPVV